MRNLPCFYFFRARLRLMLALLAAMLASDALAYQLVVIQGISNTGKAFITRSGKRQDVVLGKKATFTAENVSVIAQAVRVTGEFTQWRIENSHTAVPFQKDEVVTMYDAAEYLWALSPEEVKRKYIKSEIFSPRLSLAGHIGLARALSSSVSEASAQASQERGGLLFEAIMEREITRSFALAGGFRYAREIINLPEASIISNQLYAVAEARYYFNPIPDFYNARIWLALGAGYGQSQTTAFYEQSSGNASILPITKLALSVPVGENTDLLLESAFESHRQEERFEDGVEQTTNTNNLRYGVAIKRYLDL